LSGLGRIERTRASLGCGPHCPASVFAPMHPAVPAFCVIRPVFGSRSKIVSVLRVLPGK
jgi:hypothetical protein